MIKRFFLAGIFVVFCCSVSQAFLFENKEELRDYRLSNLFLVLSAEEPNKELYIYGELIKKLDRVIKTTTDSNAKILSETLSKLELRYALLEKEMENKSVPRHKTLILKFWAGAKSITSLESRRQEIENIESVFIFRNGSTDLPGYQIASITKKLLGINPELLIFIDQEGGLINRYVEFDGKVSFANYLTTDDYVRDTYNAFSETTKTSLGSVFPTGYKYFPSLTKIGEVYLSLPEVDKQNYLDLVAYLRLKTLEDRGINTYGFVMDLDRGNPVISNYRRSFSSDLGDYKKLGEAFLKASKKTGVSLYLKHFPGHGAGQVDSHKGILNYSGYNAYLKENIELFAHMMENKTYTKVGLMIGHMYIPTDVQPGFNSVVSDADYILTDDLAMRGYTLATGGVKDGVFFTTDVVFDNENAILVDSLLNPQIK